MYSTWSIHSVYSRNRIHELYTIHLCRSVSRRHQRKIAWKGFLSQLNLELKSLKITLPGLQNHHPTITHQDVSPFQFFQDVFVFRNRFLYPLIQHLEHFILGVYQVFSIFVVTVCCGHPNYASMFQNHRQTYWNLHEDPSHCTVRYHHTFPKYPFRHAKFEDHHLKWKLIKSENFWNIWILILFLTHF